VAKWGEPGTGAITALTTTYVSPTQITAVVPASLNAKAGTATVTVKTAGGTSAAVKFTINPAEKPKITSLSPSSVAAGGAAFTLTINGTNFVSDAVATWASNAATKLTTTYVSATQITAVVPARLIAKAGTANVTVTTAGGISAREAFTITPK